MMFRRETEEARANAWLGRVLLTRPLSFTVLTLATLAMVVALGAFFFFGEYTRKSRVTGVLAPIHGVVKIVAPQAGIVERVEVREGMAVERDTVILSLADGRLGDGRKIGASLADAYAGKERSLIAQREHALQALRWEQSTISRRRAALERELTLLGNELASQRLRAGLARQAFERALGLAHTGFLSDAAVDRERDALLEQEVRVESLLRARAGLAREAEAADHEAQAAFARSRAQVAAIDAQIATLEQDRVERQLQYRAAVVAPATGTVATVLVEPGQSIAPGTVVATLLPIDATLEAHLFAPSRSIGFVRAGQDVLLRFLAYPHQKFGSHEANVIAVAPSALPPADLGFLPPDGSREPLYRIKARLPLQTISAYGRAEPLQAGMQVEADIRLDRRRLIEWIFEPVLSLAGRA